MKRLYFFLATLCLSIFASVSANTTYDYDLVIPDATIHNNEFYVQFVGETDEFLIELNLFAKTYGEYKAQMIDGEMDYPIAGVFGRYVCRGEGVYSYSEEHRSDMLVAELIVPDKNWNVRLTMYKQALNPTDEIVCEDMTKTEKRLGWSNILYLDGTHDTYGKVQFCISGYSGYGSYSTVSGNFDGLELVGDGTYQNENGKDVLRAILATEDLSRVFSVSAYTTAVSTPETETTPLVVENAVYAYDEYGALTIDGKSKNGKTIALSLENAATKGLGTYEEGALIGTVAGTEVANLSKVAVLSLQGTTLTLTTELIDLNANVYSLTVTGVDPSSIETLVQANNIVITTKGEYLHLEATDAEGVKIKLDLYEGPTRGFGDYGYLEGVDELPWVENISYGNIALTLNKEANLAKYSQVNGSTVFEGLFDGQNNKLYRLKLSTPTNTTALDQVENTTQPTKIILKGQLYITVDGVTYNALGNMVK